VKQAGGGKTHLRDIKLDSYAASTSPQLQPLIDDVRIIPIVSLPVDISLADRTVFTNLSSLTHYRRETRAFEVYLTLPRLYG